MTRTRTGAKPRLIKFLISPEQHIYLRTAAAIRDQGVAEFCREAVLEKALEQTKHITIPGKPQKKGETR